MYTCAGFTKNKRSVNRIVIIYAQSRVIAAKYIFKLHENNEIQVM